MEGRLHCNIVLLRSSLIETIRHSTFSIESRPQMQETIVWTGSLIIFLLC